MQSSESETVNCLQVVVWLVTYLKCFSVPDCWDRLLASLWTHGRKWEDGRMDGWMENLAEQNGSSIILMVLHGMMRMNHQTGLGPRWQEFGVYQPTEQSQTCQSDIDKWWHLHIYCGCISCCRAKRTTVSLYWIVKGVLNSSMVLFNSERIAHSCFIVSFLQEDVLLSGLKVSKRMGCFMCHDGQISYRPPHLNAFHFSCQPQGAALDTLKENHHGEDVLANFSNINAYLRHALGKS